MSIGANKANNNSTSATSITTGKSGNAITKQGSTTSSNKPPSKSIFEEDEDDQQQIMNSKSSSSNKKGQQHSTQAHFYAKIQQEKNNDKKPSMSIDVSSWGRDEDESSEQETTNMIESGFSNIKSIVSSQSNNYPGINKSEEQPKKQEGSKYIAHLVKVAEDRKKEKELAQMRRVQKENNSKSATNSETQVFVTEEYKQYLKEQERWTEEKDKQLQDEINNDVTKKGMGNFYRNLLGSSNNKDQTNPNTDSTINNNQQQHLNENKAISKVEEKKELKDNSTSNNTSNNNTSIINNNNEELSSEKKRKRQDEEISTTNKEDLIVAPISTNINKDEAKLSARERYLRRKAEKEKSTE